MIVRSVNNKKIKDLSKLKDIKQIKKNKKYLVEGWNLVSEASKNNVIDEIFIVENFENSLNNDFNNYKITYITENVAKYISDTVNNQGIFAICNVDFKDFIFNNYKSILILDKIQDPGNLGTIIRTADAFNFDCVLLGKGTTNLYSPKVMRTMQGSNFHIDCFENIDILETISKMKGYEIIATSLNSSKYLEDLGKISEKRVIILGNESNGVSKDILDVVDTKIKINMQGQAESLNVGVASGILMHYIQNVLK